MYKPFIVMGFYHSSEENPKYAENGFMRPKSSLILFAVLAAPLLFLPPAVRAEDDLRVEGIVYEAKNPDETMAIVNGVPMKKGETLQDYTVKEIQQTKVVFTDQKGQDKTVSLLATKSRSENRPAGTKQAPKAAPKEPAPASPQTDSQKSPLDFLPKDLFSKLSSISVIIDMKNIRMTLMSMYGEEMQVPSVEEMVNRGSLNPAFEKGVKGNYKFSTARGSNGDPIVFADPIEGHEDLAHFMLDGWGNIRSEKDKQATEKSPISNGMAG